MSYLLTDPRTVLVVGGSDDVRDEFHAAIADASVDEVVAVDAPDGARAAFSARDDVGCVVVLAGGLAGIDGGTSGADGGTSGHADIGTNGHADIETSGHADSGTGGNAEGAGGSARESCDPDGSGGGEERTTSETARVLEAVCEAAASVEESGLLPVIAAFVDPADEDPADEDPAVAATAARYEACRYLPRSADRTDLGTVVGDALDSYERRRREAAESSLFATLLDRGDISLFAKDDAGRHLYKADLEDDVYPGDVIGETDLDVTPDGAMETARAAYEDDLTVVETGEPMYETLQHYQYGGGHDHWSLVTKVPWVGVDGAPKGLVGFAQNVTLRKRHERRLEEQSDRIDQFVSYVSHDLRTPLQIIYGALERARDGDGEALDTIERSTDRIRTIVDDLAHLSESDRNSQLSSSALRSLQAESMSTEIAPLVEEVWPVIAPDEADLRVDLPRETVVSCEAETLRPILENLLKNAVDHAGPDVAVRVGATDDNDLFVEDDGPGIPESDREKVVEPGYTTADEGTGTGLDIVARTVERQRWDLSVGESAAGGARFEIRGIPMVTRTDFDVRSADRVSLDENRDVGPVSLPGSADYDAEADRWTVVADGSDVWGDTHEFHFVHGTATPPVRIQGRVVALDGVHEFSKAGFAIRSGLAETAPFGYVGTTEAHGSEVTWRHAADGFTDSDQFEELPDTFPWYRVAYVDGVVTCFLSEDGEEWFPVDQHAVDLGESVSVGLAVCSHSGRQTCEATFADVRVEELEFEG